MTLRQHAASIGRTSAGLGVLALLVCCGPHAAPAPGPSRLEAAFTTAQVDVQPRIRRIPLPAYPRELQAQPVSGWVDVEYIIGANGRVEPASIRVVAASDAAFVPSATASVRGASFEPARKDGHPVRMVNRQRIRFQYR